MLSEPMGIVRWWMVMGRGCIVVKSASRPQKRPRLVNARRYLSLYILGQAHLVPLDLCLFSRLQTQWLKKGAPVS